MDIYFVALLILLIIFLVFILFSNSVSVLSGSPFINVNGLVLKKALELAKLKKDELFIDLGCGGGIVLAEAQKYGVRAVGYDISPWCVFLAKLKNRKYANVQVVKKNIWQVNLRQADVIYCYLMPEFLKQLAPKFKKELKHGARVISVSFQIPELCLIKKVKFMEREIFFIKDSYFFDPVRSFLKR